MLFVDEVGSSAAPCDYDPLGCHGDWSAHVTPYPHAHFCTLCVDPNIPHFCTWPISHKHTHAFGAQRVAKSK